MFLSPKGWMVVFNVKKIWEIQICKSYKSKSRTSLLKITLKSGTVKILADFGPKIYFCKSAQNTTKLILLHSGIILNTSSFI